MKKYIAIILIVLGFIPDLSAQKSNDIFTIYLVRHCEKDMSSNFSDPLLTQCGEKRAENLCDFFRDVNFDFIYSTDYNRTKSTAQPTAKAKELKLNLYDLSDLDSFSKHLKKCKQNALVVGHSNTTGVLAGLLVGEDLGAFDLDIYNRIYKVVFYEDNGQLHLLHTAFECLD